jgi:hypothetical protein
MILKPLWFSRGRILATAHAARTEPPEHESSTLQRKKGSSTEEKKVGCQSEKSTAFWVAHFDAGIGIGGRTADR